MIADVSLTGQVRPWRPATGHILFGDDERDYFAWLPAVPQGAVEATLTIDGVTRTLTGTGYRDHNWGNAPMMQLMHHWFGMIRYHESGQRESSERCDGAHRPGVRLSWCGDAAAGHWIGAMVADPASLAGRLHSDTGAPGARRDAGQTGTLGRLSWLEARFQRPCSDRPGCLRIV